MENIKDGTWRKEGTAKEDISHLKNNYMEKTAVEWLVEILDQEMSERNKFDDFAWVFEDIIHKAMDIEEQQIKDAYNKGDFDRMKLNKISADNYFELKYRTE
jgi:hypothetical protein